MATKTSGFGFVECADLINGQKYGAALKTFQQAVANFLDFKATPKRSEIARQLFQIGSTLEETLKHAFGDKWESQIPQFADDNKLLTCSFCGKNQNFVIIYTGIYHNSLLPENSQRKTDGASFFRCNCSFDSIPCDNRERIHHPSAGTDC